MSAAEQTIDLILEKSGDVSKEELIKEIPLLIALSKRDRYEIECKKFEQKYQTTFVNFERRLHSQKNQEDYGKESDLDDWEFAIASRNWWDRRIEELLT